MKDRRSKYWLGFSLTVVIGVALIWTVGRPQASVSEKWLLVSTPVIGSFTNAGRVATVVGLHVKNVGPARLDFQVPWFETRVKNQGTLLATNGFGLVQAQLLPGASTNLTMPISPGITPAEDCSSCCMVQWSEHGARWREWVDSSLGWTFSLWGAHWNSVALSEHLTNGCVFAANTDVADYFRSTYGMTREQWLEDVARMRSLTPKSGPSFPITKGPTTEERLRREARLAFVEFCQSGTDPSKDAEPGNAPNERQEGP